MSTIIIDIILFFYIDLSNDDYLHFLLEARDLTRFSELAMRLMKAGKEGLFETWMMKESDLVQVCKKLILQQFLIKFMFLGIMRDTRF